MPSIKCLACNLQRNGDFSTEKNKVKERLEYLRGELKSGSISYGELAELQDLKDYIEPGDVELLEAAGVPENK